MLLILGTIGSEILFRPSKFPRGETIGTVGVMAATPAPPISGVSELGFGDPETRAAEKTDVELEAEIEAEDCTVGLFNPTWGIFSR